MRKVKAAIIFAVDILLMGFSWVCYKYPHGDEYLVLFMTALVFMVAPFIMSVNMVGLLLGLNLLFFVWYGFLGALNLVDIIVLTFLLAGCAVASHAVRVLLNSFERYYREDIRAEESAYDDIVRELERIDQRGRTIENELTRISKLYEITKHLAPVLKFEELLDALFAFLQENFHFQATHLLVFNNGNFFKGISKGVVASGDDRFGEKGQDQGNLEYEGVVELCRHKDLKPFFISRSDNAALMDSLSIRSDQFMAFPVMEGNDVLAIIAIEGASRSSYGRFRILVPQINLEFRKVELYEQVQELSIVDGLTEVYLRRYLMGRLEEEVDRARRLGLTFSLGMVDVDHFKTCNDRYGHQVGDTVLKKIAERLKHSVREVDMVARYGGEEFCVVLPDTTKKLAVSVADRLRKSVEAHDINAFNEKIKITVSVGVATYPEDGDTVASLIEKADTALYRAKRGGRNAVCSA